MKRVAMIKTFDSCHECPYHSGGRSLGSPMYCKYFDPPKRIFNSNGHDCKFESDRDIAAFCELPEDEVFRMDDVI